MEYAVPEMAEVISRKKILKSAVTSVGQKTLRKQLGGGSKRTRRFIPTKSTNINSRSLRHFHKHFTLNMNAQSNFRYQPFVVVPGSVGGKVPVVDDVLSSHEQQIHPTTSLDENSIAFEFQTDRNNYTDLRQTYFVFLLFVFGTQIGEASCI